MVNILYCWQISDKFLILYSFDTLKVITSTENGFEENKSISGHFYLVKSSGEYFEITTELRVSEIFSGNSNKNPGQGSVDDLFRSMIIIKESGFSLYSGLYCTKPGMHCKLWWRCYLYQSVR